MEKKKRKAVAPNNQIKELVEISEVFLRELSEEHGLTVAEYSKLLKRMTENDMMYVQIFQLFSKYLEEEVAALRSNKTARYKKFVDNLLRGDN